MALYPRIAKHLAKHEYGANKQQQFTQAFQRSFASKEPFHIAGFICPLYEMDQSLLGKGFSYAVTGIGKGQIEEYPRYQEKLDRLLGLIQLIEHELSPYVPTVAHIIMGDKGIINGANLEKRQNLPKTIEENLQSYKEYIAHHSVSTPISYEKISDLTSHFPEFGKPCSDLIKDGKILKENSESLSKNERVSRIVTHEQLQLGDKEGGSIRMYEPLGFALNYGIAGLALRQHGIDMIVGSDKPGSYLNHLYHAFSQPEDLYVEVAI